MELKKIIAEAVREALPGVVRDLVRKELGFADSRPSAESLSLPIKRRARRPRAASEHGVSVGQKWEGRSYTQAKGRVIEIVALGKEKATPKILKSTSDRPVAKGISYGMLTKAYRLVD